MGREIKFRAWDKAEKEMQMVTDGFFNKQSFLLKSFITKGSKAMYSTNGSYHELMQYIGRKDADGNEIYEGDIVRFKTDGLSGKGFVYWDEEVAQFWIEDIREQTNKRGKRYYPFYKDAIYRIVGNIYENPELLEESK